MILKDQKVVVSWNNNNVNHYKSLGFSFSKIKDKFEVDINQLPKGSNLKVLITCDNCGNPKLRSYSQALADNVHFCSKECRASYNKHSREFLISEFFRFKNEYGRNPEQSEMQVNQGFPSYYYYLKIWDTWNKFLLDIGILDDDGWLIEEKEILISMYSTEKEEDILKELNYKYVWGSLQSKARKLGLKRKCLYIERGYTKQELVNSFWKFYEENGRYPYSKELKSPSCTAYTRVFGSWTKFLIEINVLGDKGWYKCDEEVLKKYYALGSQEEIMNKLMIKRNWDSIKKKASSLGLSRDIEELYYSKRRLKKSFLLNEIRRFYSENLRVPTCNDFENNPNFHGRKAYIKQFGSWNNAIIEAGFSVNDGGYGHHCEDLNGNLCRSGDEAGISNLFIINGIEVVYEPYYEDVIMEENASNLKFDWSINNNNKLIYIEYFGLYYEKPYNEASESYHEKTKRKIKLCNDHNIPLLSLFPEDLKRNYEGLIQKFGKYDIKISKT